jgi:proteic killer suppression protein
MEIVFADESLALIETDDAGATRFPIAVIRSARKKLVLLRAATDDRTLRNWKSLHYEKLKGDRDGQRSIRLNNQFRMVFTLDNEADPKKVTILGIEDYHR